MHSVFRASPSNLKVINMKKSNSQDTNLVFDADEFKDQYGAVIPPVYNNSLFTFETWEELEKVFENRSQGFIYSRGNNPTVCFTETKIAEFAGGEKAKLFASGMAAISAGMLHFLDHSSHLIIVKNAYGPTLSLINRILKPKMDVSVTFVSGTDIEEIEGAIQPNTKLIYLESPSSVVFSLQDIKKISALANRYSISTMIDNSWATPIFQKPLAMGVDLEVHSCSKYLGGHSDIVAGVLIGSKRLIEKIHLQEYELFGARLSASESSLLLRSLRTLHLRMSRHQESALKIAMFLERNSKVKKVFYPGLKSFPQHELANQQMSGFSGLLSFQLDTDNLQLVKRFFNSLRLFQKGVSWGGHESLVYCPAISCLREQTEEQMNLMGISLSDMRFSIGLENPDDLIADVEKALLSI